MANPRSTPDPTRLSLSRFPARHLLLSSLTLELGRAIKLGLRTLIVVAVH